MSAESIKEVETSSSSARATTTVEDEDGQVADVLERLRRDRHLARLVDGAPAQVAKAVAARLDDGWDPARLATTVLAAHDWPAARGAGLLLTALAGLGAPPTRAMRPHHPDPTCPGCAGTGWRLEPGDPSAAAEPCPDCRTTRTDAA